MEKEYNPNDLLLSSDIEKMFGITRQSVSDRVKKGTYKIFKKIPISAKLKVNTFLRQDILNEEGERPSPDEILTVMEVASILGVTKTTVFNRIKSGSYKVWKVLETHNTRLFLLLRSNVFSVEKDNLKRLLPKTESRHNNITCALAREVLENSVLYYTLIEDLIIGDEIQEAKGTNNRGDNILINYKDFQEYLDRKWGLDISNLITAKQLEAYLYRNRIELDLNNFIRKYKIKKEYSVKENPRYSLYDKNKVKESINIEKEDKLEKLMSLQA